MKTKAGIRISNDSKFVTTPISQNDTTYNQAVREFWDKRAGGIRIQSTYLTIELEKQ